MLWSAGKLRINVFLAVQLVLVTYCALWIALLSLFLDSAVPRSLTLAMSMLVFHPLALAGGSPAL